MLSAFAIFVMHVYPWSATVTSYAVIINKFLRIKASTNVTNSHHVSLEQANKHFLSTHLYLADLCTRSHQNTSASRSFKGKLIYNIFCILYILLLSTQVVNYHLVGYESRSSLLCFTSVCNVGARLECLPVSGKCACIVCDHAWSRWPGKQSTVKRL